MLPDQCTFRPLVSTKSKGILLGLRFAAMALSILGPTWPRKSALFALRPADSAPTLCISAMMESTSGGSMFSMLMVPGMDEPLRKMGAACFAGDGSAALHNTGCLLYTSDAADEEDSVDLGGRRI